MGGKPTALCAECSKELQQETTARVEFVRRLKDHEAEPCERCPTKARVS